MHGDYDVRQSLRLADVTLVFGEKLVFKISFALKLFFRTLTFNSFNSAVTMHAIHNPFYGFNIIVKMLKCKNVCLVVCLCYF